MILRLLQTNSFNGKMHALNEVNRLIAILSPASRISFGRSDETVGLTADNCMVRLETANDGSRVFVVF